MDDVRKQTEDTSDKERKKEIETIRSNYRRERREGNTPEQMVA